MFSWNRFLTAEQRTTTDLKTFITKLLRSFKPTPKSYFGVNDRIGLRYLTQLRVDLNPLRFYKFRSNFADTNNSLCLFDDGVEDIGHFLLDCPQFSEIRDTLMSNVSRLGVDIHTFTRKNQIKLLLYGKIAYKDDVNRSILLETISFIHKSNKFKRLPSVT